MQNFRNLEVWNKAHGLVLEVYRVTDGFPRTEVFGLTSQLRRAAASIAANLAEGYGRTQLEFAGFIQIAFGSASEVEYHLLLARDLGFLDSRGYERLAPAGHRNETHAEFASQEDSVIRDAQTRHTV